jgi:surface antigen
VMGQRFPSPGFRSGVMVLVCTLLTFEVLIPGLVAQAHPDQGTPAVLRVQSVGECWPTCDAPNTNPYSGQCQCVHYAWERAADSGHRLPQWGYAHCWDDGARYCGYTVSGRPASGGVAVWESEQAGAWPGGHVAWVDAVDGDRFHVWHMNWGEYCTPTEGWFVAQPGISFIHLGASHTPTIAPTATPAPTVGPLDNAAHLPLLLKGRRE